MGYSSGQLCHLPKSHHGPASAKPTNPAQPPSLAIKMNAQLPGANAMYYIHIDHPQG